MTTPGNAPPPGPGIGPGGAETLPEEITVKDDNNLGKRTTNKVNTAGGSASQTLTALVAKIQNRLRPKKIKNSQNKILIKVKSQNWRWISSNAS
jgi:hypothetical protein